MIFKAFSAITLLLAAVATAGADTTIKTSSSFGGQTSTDTVYIKDGKMRVDSGREGGFMIFDSNAGTITAVHSSEQSYTVMTEENLRAMGDAVSQAMRQMEQQLAQLPPQQREQVRRMMEQQMGAMMGGGDRAPETEIVRTGESRNVAGHECEVVRMMAGGQSKGTACVTDFADLGMPSEDRETILSLVEFSQSLMEQFGDLVPAHMSAMASNGYPIEYETQMGNTRITGRLESVDTDSLSSELFQVPAGYSERRMPAMPGG